MIRHPKPPYPRPNLKRLPRREAMTVCIAGKSALGSEIVTVSDLKVTKGFYSSDFVTLKSERIHPSWLCLISGKISGRRPFIRRLQTILEDDKTYSAEDVAKNCTELYIEKQKQLAYEKVLSKYDLTFDSFLKSRQHLGDTIFERLWGEISRVQVGFDMIVAGFESRASRIFIVSNPTEENPSFITYCDDESFAAIGTGAYVAESLLFSFRHRFGVPDLNQTIYELLAAKFEAESASDVGDAT
jgi:hypothetical protein